MAEEATDEGAGLGVAATVRAAAKIRWFAVVRGVFNMA